MIDNRICQSFVTAFGINPSDFRPDMGPGDVPHWDSLGHVKLVEILQKEFGVEFEVDEIMSMENVPAIREILLKRGITE